MRIPSMSLQNHPCVFTLSLTAVILGTCDINRAAAGEPRAGRTTLQDRVGQIKAEIAKNYSYLESLYKQLHTRPELSLQEEKTAGRLAREMKEIGFDVTTKVGGHGLVCLLRNGNGPTV